MFENIRLNLKPLIGSIVISLVLWFLVATEKEYDYQIKVPLTVIRLAQGKTLREKIPEYAVIEVRGKGRSLIAIWFYDIKYNLELPDVRSDQTISLADHLNFLDLPATFGIQILNIIEPNSIELKVDDAIVEKKPVYLSGNIGTEDGYILLQYDFDSDSIEVAGPKRLIREIRYIHTDTLELVNQKTNLIEEISLKNPYPGLIEINPKAVKVNFDIQRLSERTINDVPITFTHVPYYLEVEAIPPEIKSLRIKGGFKLIAAIDTSDIRAEIDYRNYRPEKEEYAAQIITPENISWIETNPKTFKLKVKRK